MRPMAVRITSAVALVAATLALAIVAPEAKAVVCNGVVQEPCVVAPGLVAEPVITSFPNYGSGGFYPTNFALAPSPSTRIFIADKSGRVLMYDQAGDTTPTVSLNIRDEVHDYWDRGILGMTLDPQYVGNGGVNDYVYVLYTYDDDPKDTNGPVPRWQIDSNGGDGCPSPNPGGNGSNADGCVVTAQLSKFHLGSNGVADQPEDVLVSSDGSAGWCSQFPSHSIGTLIFGPDGNLYAGAGDGASFDTADWGQLGGTRPNAGNPIIPVNPCNDPASGGASWGRGTKLFKPDAEGGSMRSLSVLSGVNDGYSPYDGAIIRVAKDGTIPAGNPLRNNGIATDDAIVAYGFRNPFRFNFKPGTNELWIGDVGRGAWEEISKATVGGTTVPNFGWPCWEGPSENVDYLGPSGTTICNAVANDTTQSIGTKVDISPLVTPKIAWGHGSDWDLHTDTGCLSTTAGNTPGTSATGGAFVTANDWPVALRGAYVFGDYGRKCVWAITAAQAADNGTNAQTLGRSLTPIASGIQVVSVQTGADGSIYVLDIGDVAGQGGPAAGLYRIGPRRFPVAAFSWTPATVLPGATVSFTSTGTSAIAPATIASYDWDLDGDGNFGDSAVANPSRAYAAGQYQVALRVTDSQGLQQTASRTVVVGTPPTVDSLVTDVGPGGFVQGQTVHYTIGASPGGNPINAYNVAGLIRHCDSPTSSGCHEHPNALGTLANAASGSFVAPGHAGYSFLQLVVTVTDSVGLTGTKTFDVPAAWLVSHVDTFPSGLTVTRNGNPGAAPNVVEEIGSPDTVIAVPPVQTKAGVSYLFTGWSDRPDLGPSRTFTPGSGTIDLVAQFAAANGLTSFAPRRVLDTRDGTGAPAGAVEGGSTVTLDLRAAGVPATATGVLLNVTTTAGSQGGFVTVYPCSAPRPLASNLNYTAGQTVANLVQVAIDGTGQLCLYAHGTTHLVADLSGWFEVAGKAFTPVTPTRVLDTRAGTGAPVGPLAAESSLELDLSAVVPAGATTAVLNVTATEPVGPGFVTAYPCGGDRPLASNLNVTAGDTRPNQVVVALGAGSRVCLYSHTTTHLVADLLGYYGASGVKVATQTPERVMDTRDGTGGSTRLGTGATAVLDLSGQAPAGSTGVVLNVTGVEPANASFVTVYPCGVERPLASNLNITPGDIRPNLVTVPLGTAGQVCLFSQAPIDLVVDVAGWAVNVA